MMVLWIVLNYKPWRRDDIQRHDDHKMERKFASFEYGAREHTTQRTRNDIIKFFSSYEIKKVIPVSPETRRLEMSLKVGVSARSPARLKTTGEWLRVL
jgi:hypothetical protein